MKRTYQGSCHCGEIRHAVDLDLEAGTSRCNCTRCAKFRAWGATVQPADFRLLSGEERLSEYRFNTRQVQHLFCSRCGAAPFSRGDIPELGGPFVSINVACLDGVTPEHLAALPVQYCDGRHDNWMQPPAVTTYL